MKTVFKLKKIILPEIISFFILIASFSYCDMIYELIYLIYEYCKH